MPAHAGDLWLVGDGQMPDRDAGEDTMAFVFEDRAEAGRKLVAALDGRDWGGAVVYPLPRSGVPAAEIARAFGLPLDLLLVRKIGAPGHPELALGAVVDGAAPDIAINEDVAASYGFDEADVPRWPRPTLPRSSGAACIWKAGHQSRRRSRTAIVVDDGIATGASLMAALHALARRQLPASFLPFPWHRPKRWHGCAPWPMRSSAWKRRRTSPSALTTGRSPRWMTTRSSRFTCLALIRGARARATAQPDCPQAAIRDAARWPCLRIAIPRRWMPPWRRTASCRR
ncbi:MAG: phosphoribosyltransferase family protein [Zhengella sp.]